MTPRVRLGETWVGEGCPVYVIAEAGVNHNGDMRLARELVDAARAAGADAVKFQSFKTEKIITAAAPSAEYHKKATGGKESWYDLLKRLELSETQQRELAGYCRERRIDFLSTPYDEESAVLLDSLGVGAFKIASTDANNIPLLTRVAAFGKPILLSTGMADMPEIRESVEAVRKAGNDQVILLQCTSNYPPEPRDLNLNVIATLRAEFGVPVGYSDHFAARAVPVAAVAKGACVYEAHFTMDRALPGPDQRSSLEPDELKTVVGDIRLTELILGSPNKEVTPSEAETRQKLRKSITAIARIRKGEEFSRDNIGVKRPGTGLPPKALGSLIGKRARRDISRDEMIRMEDVE
jgi:N-acetylneuraminate synthase/N,N'-diacetyllegionaminate synthase